MAHMCEDQTLAAEWLLLPKRFLYSQISPLLFFVLFAFRFGLCLRWRMGNLHVYVQIYTSSTKSENDDW